MVKDSIQWDTAKRYIGQIRIWHQYCKSKNISIWNQPTNVKVYCAYLLQRVQQYSINVLTSSMRGITFLYVDLLQQQSPFINNDYFNQFKYKLNKIYGKSPDGRLPITLHHHILFAKYLKINKITAKTANFNNLLYLVVDQVYGFIGWRSGDLIKDNVTTDQVRHYKFIYNEKEEKIRFNWTSIINKKYKNMINKKDYMFGVLGGTNYLYIDPWFYLKTYMARRPKTKHKKLLVWKDGSPFTWENFGQLMTIYKQKIIHLDNKMKITNYCLRIGVATMLQERGVEGPQIDDYMGWKQKTDPSARTTYIRMSRLWKCSIPQSIIDTPIKILGITLKPTNYKN